MRRVVSALKEIEAAAVFVLAAAALGLSCFAILARYAVPRIAVDWVIEVVVFLLIWAIFLGMARLAGQDGHIRVDIAVRLLKRPARRAAATLSVALGLAVAGFLVWSGVLVVGESIQWDERTASSLRFPLWIYYLSLPVGAGLTVIRLFGRLTASKQGGDAPLPRHGAESG